MTLTGAAPKNEPIRMNADPICVKRSQGAAVAGNLRRQRRRQARQRVRLRQGRTRQLRLRPAGGRRQAGSAGLPLHAARVRRPRRPADRDHQQRPDAAQHPRDAEGQPRVQQRPADPGHEDDAHLQGEGSDGALQVRRARLDERLRRRARPSVLRGDEGRRLVRAEGPAAGHLHDRGLAREARRHDAERHARREGIEGRQSFSFDAAKAAAD